MATPQYEAKRNDTSAVSAWLMHIHFDAFFDVPAKDFYFSTTKDTEFYLDGSERVFAGKLSAVPQGRHQRERGNDYAQFSLSNPHNETYQDFLAYESIIERGEIRIFQCFEIDKNYWEGEQRFYGYLKDFTINERDKTIDFTATSDMSRPGFPVGARILTRERCGTEFNFNGIFAPEYHPCGWQLAMGGDPTGCTKFLKGPRGCISHGNAHRFYAVTALSIAAVEFVPGGTVDFPYETQGCFTKSAYVVLPDWTRKPIDQVRAGYIKARHLFTGKIVDTRIEEFQIHSVREIAVAQFAKGQVIESTREHLFRVEKAVFMPLGAMEGKWAAGMNGNLEDARNRIVRVDRIAEPQFVYNYRTEHSTFIITDAEGSFYFDVHNNKQMIPYQQV